MKKTTMKELQLEYIRNLRERFEIIDAVIDAVDMDEFEAFVEELIPKDDEPDIDWMTRIDGIEAKIKGGSND